MRLQADHDVAVYVEQTVCAQCTRSKNGVNMLCDIELSVDGDSQRLIDSTRCIPETAGGGIAEARLLHGNTKTNSRDCVLFKDRWFSFTRPFST